MVKEWMLPLVKKIQVTKEVYSFYFVISGQDFHYLPGQYVRMILPHDSPDDRGTSRFFTIASSPHERESITITTKLLKSSFKEKLFMLQEGEKVSIAGPLGSFILDENEKEPHVFLSGGMGITPFYSMMKYAFAKQVSIPLHLFASFSSADTVIYASELADFAKHSQYLQSIITVSENTQGWNGEKGRITPDLIKRSLVPTGKEIYYICGPTTMVDQMRGMLDESGVSEENIRTENYSGY